MNRKICCPDFAFPLMEHDKVLKLIALLGMKGIDIGLFENRSHIVVLLFRYINVRMRIIFTLMIFLLTDCRLQGRSLLMRIFSMTPVTIDPFLKNQYYENHIFV